MLEFCENMVLFVCVLALIGRVLPIELLDNLSHDKNYLLEINTKAHGLLEAKRKCAQNNAILAPIHDSFDRPNFAERIDEYVGKIISSSSGCTIFSLVKTFD